MMKVAVVGIGQSLRGDDAAGLMAIQLWQEKYPETAGSPEVQVESDELPGLALLDMLEGVDVAILVDAVHSSAAPGTIHRLNENDLSAFASDAKSAHGWGVAETLNMGRLLGKTGNAFIRLIGIEAKQMTLGMGLSKTIQETIPLVCEAIQKEVESHLVK
ncbi:MAG TPA: hydrogenase maturation protease [Anaerolineales bacterium]|nr:hydrogenase maturation protease [Anaerolineales bacterium]